MKAAMQAAMELEGRLEALENSVEAFQQRFEAHQESAASKADLEALEQRQETARRELLVAVAAKADLEQLGQCLQAVRHELGEVVKRKANSELVDSNIRALREEVLGHLAGHKAGLDGLRGRTEAFHREVAATLQTKAGSQELEQQMQTLHAIANEAARRSELDRIELFIERELPTLLQQKADVAAAQRLEASLETSCSRLVEALAGKADSGDVEAVRQTASRKADAQQLSQSIQALRQEVVVSLQSKVNTDLLEQRIQAARAECLQEAQQKIAESVQAKADLAHVDHCIQNVQVLVQADLAQVDQRIEGVQGAQGELREEWGRRFEELSTTKADREKVVEIVEAVRDEMIEATKQRPDFEEQFASSLQDLEDRLQSKVEESKVEQKLRSVRQDFTVMFREKADVDLVTERILASEQALANQVAQDIETAREGLSVLIGRKVDMELMDRRMQTLHHEVTEALKVRAAGGPRRRSFSKETEGGGKKGKGTGYWKDGQFIIEEEEDNGSEGTTIEGWGDRMSEDATMCDMEEWMDHRMRLVKIELTKLVDLKADRDQVDTSMRVMRKEVADHVDSRVQAAQQTLTEHMDRQAQAVRKELKADVNMLTQCMTQVDQTFDALQGDKPLPIRNFREILQGPVATLESTQASPESMKAGQPWQEQPGQEEDVVAGAPRPVRGRSASRAEPRRAPDSFSADDLRTRRVRDLLTQLVQE